MHVFSPNSPLHEMLNDQLFTDSMSKRSLNFQTPSLCMAEVDVNTQILGLVEALHTKLSEVQRSIAAMSVRLERVEMLQFPLPRYDQFFSFTEFSTPVPPLHLRTDPPLQQQSQPRPNPPLQQQSQPRPDPPCQQLNTPDPTKITAQTRPRSPTTITDQTRPPSPTTITAQTRPNESHPPANPCR